MATYQKSSQVSGAWVKTNELKSGINATIVSETNPQPSQWTNKDGSPKTQDVAKVRFEGSSEVVNVSLNRATINGLVDSFGEDSAKWQNKALTVETEKMRVAGKAVVALYLIPEGYERTDDENGYAIIIKKGSKVESNEVPIIEDEDEKQ